MIKQFFSSNLNNVYFPFSNPNLNDVVCSSCSNKWFTISVVQVTRTSCVYDFI